jgi:hypothetical protein
MKRGISLAVISILLVGANATTLCEIYCVRTRQDASACHDDLGTTTRMKPIRCGNAPAATLVLLPTAIKAPAGLERAAIPAHAQIETVALGTRTASAESAGVQTGIPPALVQLRI